MGYICPHCGEGLPEDTPCPCAMGPDDDDDDDEDYAGIPTRIGWRALTRELDDISSPVRLFLNQFTPRPGLLDLQSRYRKGAPQLAIPALPPSEVNPGTLGGAADWLLRFLVFPRPSLHLAAAGAMMYGWIRPTLEELASMLGMTISDLSRGRETFTGPVCGNAADPELLARACWALALLTEVYRGGPAIAGPLAPFTGRFAAPPSAVELLELASSAALSQLAELRCVFETELLPALAERHGMWALGPTFKGSSLMNADADLVAAGLLLDLKTSKKLTLGVKDVLQVIGYVLLDFDDEFGIAEVGIFAARYAYLATWDLASLLGELAGSEVDLQSARHQFRRLLVG
jgi:hypothetical protein